MNIWLGVLLIVLGLAFVFLEFIIPSGGLLTVVSVICFVGCLVIAGANGVAYFSGFLAAIVVLTPVALMLAINVFPRTPFGKAMILRPPGKEKKGTDPDKTEPVDKTERKSVPDYSQYNGKVGIAETMLRPSGVADIDGDRVNVVSEGGVIEKGTRVRVARIDGYRVVVKPETDNA